MNQLMNDRIGLNYPLVFEGRCSATFAAETICNELSAQVAVMINGVRAPSHKDKALRKSLP